MIGSLTIQQLVTAEWEGTLKSHVNNSEVNLRTAVCCGPQTPRQCKLLKWSNISVKRKVYPSNYGDSG